MLEASLNGLMYILNPISLVYMFIGVTFGLLIGFLPGLGGIVAMALILPFTIGMDVTAALVLLLGAHVATVFGSSITGILFGVPGAAKSITTVFDGYPMTQRGEGARALGASATASMFGGIIGAIFLMATLPAVRAVMLAVGPPEYFIMALWGLSIIAMFSAGSIMKGLAAAGLGILISFIGMNPITGSARYTFGSIHLFDGISFPVAVIGLFAISQMIDLYVKGGSIVQAQNTKDQGSVWTGVKDCWIHRWLLIRSAILGVYIGALPGVGASVGGIAAYGQAVQTCKNPETFGTGRVEGVIAPDATAAATEGGGLVPTLGFGIPGGESKAILLAAFISMGIAPGREMLTVHLDMVFAMVWIIVIANIFATSIGLGVSKHLVKISSLPGKILIPMILAVCIGGAFAVNGRFVDVLVATGFGIVGYYLKKYGYSRADMVIGMVLGLMIERYLHISINLYGPTFFLVRPVAFILLLLVIFTIVYPFIKAYRKGRKGVEA